MDDTNELLQGTTIVCDSECYDAVNLQLRRQQSAYTVAHAAALEPAPPSVPQLPHPCAAVSVVGAGPGTEGCVPVPDAPKPPAPGCSKGLAIPRASGHWTACGNI